MISPAALSQLTHNDVISARKIVPTWSPVRLGEPSRGLYERLKRHAPLTSWAARDVEQPLDTNQLSLRSARCHDTWTRAVLPSTDPATCGCVPCCGLARVGMMPVFFWRGACCTQHVQAQAPHINNSKVSSVHDQHECTSRETERRRDQETKRVRDICPRRQAIT